MDTWCLRKSKLSMVILERGSQTPQLLWCQDMERQSSSNVIPTLAQVVEPRLGFLWSAPFDWLQKGESLGVLEKQVYFFNWEIVIGPGARCHCDFFRPVQIKFTHTNFVPYSFIPFIFVRYYIKIFL